MITTYKLIDKLSDERGQRDIVHVAAFRDNELIWGYSHYHGKTISEKIMNEKFKQMLDEIN